MTWNKVKEGNLPEYYKTVVGWYNDYGDWFRMRLENDNMWRFEDCPTETPLNLMVITHWQYIEPPVSSEGAGE